MDREEVEAAELRMNDARDTLLTYVEQQKELDREHYRRLVARVKRAEAEFLRAVSGLEK